MSVPGGRKVHSDEMVPISSRRQWNAGAPVAGIAPKTTVAPSGATIAEVNENDAASA
jgi:hypothetical protein